ncbi:MAG: hypothetical protein Q8L39_04655 [Burkholderiales bacterium]|nr:hypothetical protein [Burkholderiales bacterium]
MTTKTKTELAIDFIAKQGVARSADIGEASGIQEKSVCTMLYHYVRGGVLVSCRVEQSGKPSCNEYRLATGVTAQTWRDFKVGLFSEAAVPKAPPKRITPPAPTPADQPQVSVTNSGSTQVVPPATGRAVTEKKPHRKATQRAPGVGGHVTAKVARNIPENIPDPDQARFGYWSDGNLSIMQGDMHMVLPSADAGRLAEFLINCMTTTGVDE